MLVSTYLSSFLCWLQVFAPRLDFLVHRFIPPSYMTGWDGSCRWLYGIRFTCGSSEELLFVSLWRVFVFAILELQVYSGNVHDFRGFMCKVESTGYTTCMLDILMIHTEPCEQVDRYRDQHSPCRMLFWMNSVTWEFHACGGCPSRNVARPSGVWQTL